MTIDFYFDFASPYAYFGRHGLAALAKRYGRDIAYHPVDLTAMKKAVGNYGPPTREIPAKLAFANRDFKRWSARYGIPFSAVRSNKARDLNVGCLFAAQKHVADRYVELGFAGGWGSGGALDDPALARSIVEALGLDLAEYLAFVGSPEAEAAYQREFQAALERQVFGVPTMIVDGELWWGNDRLFMVEEYLAGSTPAKAALRG